MLGFFLSAATYAEDICATQETNISKADIDYYYLWWYTEQGKSMIDLLIMQKPALKDTDKDVRQAADQKRALITHFCDVILRTRDDGNIQRWCVDNGAFRYDPRQSLFVYALCVNIDDKSWDKEIASMMPPKRDFREIFTKVQYQWADKPFSLTDYIDEDIDKDLNVVWWLPKQEKLEWNPPMVRESCNPAQSMNGCDFSRFLPHIFNEVMNTYANLKLVSIYGYKYVLTDASTEEQKIQREKAIIDFSHSYFSPPPKDTKDSNNECWEKGWFYLNKADKENNKKHCQHTKVYKILDETIKSTQKLVKEIDLLDVDVLMAAECVDYKDNIMSCAFSSTGSSGLKNSRTAFQNLYINELMRYSLFSTYYANQILNMTVYDKIKIGNYAENINENQKEAQQMLWEVRIARQSMYQTMRWLTNLSTTFPVHIALMAYLEDLVHYRTILARIYTPLHQLSYLRQDTQACE